MSPAQQGDAVARLELERRCMRIGSSGLADRGTQVFHQQVEVVRIGWRRLEFGKVLVEGAGHIGLRVDQQRSRTDGVRRLRRPKQHLFHQCPAESTPLFAEVDAQASQQHDRDPVAARALRHSPWCASALDRARGESEVAHHTAASGQAYDIDDARLSRFGLERVLPKPVRLRVRAAVEFACVVVAS